MRKPIAWRLPASATRRTSRFWPGSKRDRRAGGDVEAKALRACAVELQRRIGLEEMVVRADLDRPVAGIGDFERDRVAALVHDDVAGRGERLAGDERVVGAADRLMHGDELGAVGERRLDLDVVDHRRDAVHHLIGGDDMRARLHQLGDRAAVARALDDEIGDQRDRLGMVELDAALEAAARDDRRHGDQQLVFFARRQIHAFPPDGVAGGASKFLAVTTKRAAPPGRAAPAWPRSAPRAIDSAKARRSARPPCRRSRSRRRRAFRPARRRRLQRRPQIGRLRLRVRRHAQDRGDRARAGADRRPVERRGRVGKAQRLGEDQPAGAANPPAVVKPRRDVGFARGEAAEHRRFEDHAATRRPRARRRAAAPAPPTRTAASPAAPRPAIRPARPRAASRPAPARPRSGRSSPPTGW